MIFFRVTQDSCQRLNQILQEFGRLPRLQINKNKSLTWFSENAPRNVKYRMAKILRIKMVDMIDKYLGSYVDCFDDKRKIGHEVIQKITKKLQGWKTKMLS